MRHRLTLLAIISSVTLTGCNLWGAPGSHSPNGTDGQMADGSSGVGGVLSRLRPKPDSAVIERMHEEDAVRKQKADEAAAKLLAEQQKQQQANGGGNGFDMSTLTRMLPKVSTDPIAPPAEEIAVATGPVFTPAENSQATSSPAQIAPAALAKAGSTPATPPVESYGGYSAAAAAVPPAPPGGLIPPPPAVSLTTKVDMAPAPPPYADPNNPYANPYLNPYAIPYPQQYMQPPPQMMPPTHPSGSPFASGGKVSSSDSSGNEEEDKAAQDRAKKLKDFVPITPVGMEALSPYKQRDDLRVLWKGAMSQASLKDVMASKFGEQVQRVDVGLPNNPSKGTFAVDQRMLNTLFGGTSVDVRIAPVVHKVEQDVTQAYYRYLYAYNRFSLSQQTLAARKQEVDVAGSAAEQQRAAADLSAAQSDADSTKDDMHQAQLELASVAGANAARTIIGHVSHVSPSLDSLAQAQQQQPQGSPDNKNLGEEIGRRALHLLGFGHGDNKDAQPQAEPAKVAKADGKESKKKEKEKDKEKPGKKSKEKAVADKGGDLSPNPTTAAQDKPDAGIAADPGAPPAAVAQASPDGISFELKGVNVTPRKSVLTVAIRNSGSNNYSFSPTDAFSISEGNHKISEAAVRADFDTTLVQPNQEVKGTITIFGRPWSDKLAVVLSDGGKSIQLKRQ